MRIDVNVVAPTLLEKEGWNERFCSRKFANKEYTCTVHRHPNHKVTPSRRVAVAYLLRRPHRKSISRHNDGCGCLYQKAILSVGSYLLCSSELRRFLGTNNLRIILLRYTIMTGIYVLTTMETIVIHSLLLLSLYFCLRYTWSFVGQVMNYITLPQLQVLKEGGL